MENQRLLWADQTKGIGIFLMVYAHNFPIFEYYIYTFHMPLFFFVAGMFHPKKSSSESIVKRAKTILIPYFLWGSILYLFWLFIGRYYGDSSNMGLSPLNNFIGVFYAQGDNAFMNWGIPMWFLPCIFVTFCLFTVIRTIPKQITQISISIVLICLGFLYSHFYTFKLPWSIDVACVSLIFYVVGFYLKDVIKNLKYKHILTSLLIISLVHFSFVFLNSIKVDMYRSIYGNQLLFVLNGLSGTLMVILILKLFKFPDFLAYLGKHTLVLLALHGRALTFIKLLLVVGGFSVLSFNEPTKFVFAILQCILVVPAIWLVNKYIPIMNGKI